MTGEALKLAPTLSSSAAVGRSDGEVSAELEALDSALTAALTRAAEADQWDAATRREVLTRFERASRTLAAASNVDVLDLAG